MRKCILSFAVGIFLAAPASAAPWVRSYIVTSYEPAWHFGGNDGFHKAGTLQPGSDCPGGSFPEIDYNRVLLTPWRDAKVVEQLLHPPHTDPQVLLTLKERLLTYRGFRDGIDVYFNPFSAPDPGMQEVTGKIAEGFDLDNNSRTGGFTSPEGERGIDNAFYRAWGCLSVFRDTPYRSILSRRANDEMAIEGLFTFVIRVSGNKDPTNDDDVTVEIGFSPDQAVIANGAVLSDYSFRLAKNGEYSKVKATVKNGVVETTPVNELHAPRIAWFPNQYGDADFHQGRLRLATDRNGNVSGIIGGYRDWRELFVEIHFPTSGGHEEQRDHQDSMGMYYAIKRNADGMPDPKTGKNMGISIAYRFNAVPAFVVDPVMPLPTTITMTPSVKEQLGQINGARAAFYKAVATRRIQPLPLGSWEAGQYDHVYPQQQLDGSWKLVPIPKDGPEPVVAPKQSVAPTPEKPKEQQVRNDASSTSIARK